MANRPLDPQAILQRQWKRYGPELFAMEAADDDVPVPRPLTDEELVRYRAELERVRPGLADWVLGNYQGAMPDWQLAALDEIPPGFPATKADFVAAHEALRVLLGDLRPPLKVVDSGGAEQPGSGHGD